MLIDRIRAVDPKKVVGKVAQRSLQGEVSLEGVGVHTGRPVTLRLVPAPANTGVLFRRVDLPGSPEIPAHVSCVHETPRSTNLACGGAAVHTVEHLLSALAVHGICNLYIELTGPEVPIAEGSAATFMEMIASSGIKTFEETLPVVGVESPLFFSQGDTHLVVLPSSEYRISCTLHYPQEPMIGTQYYTGAVSADAFAQDLAPCRTFCLYQEVAPLLERGLIQGGSLDCAVVVKPDEVMCRPGLFFQDEMVRHKALDLIGDLSLLGLPFVGHVLAVRSGHQANTAIAKLLHNHVTMECR